MLLSARCIRQSKLLIIINLKLKKKKIPTILKAFAISLSFTFLSFTNCKGFKVPAVTLFDEKNSNYAQSFCHFSLLLPFFLSSTVRAAKCPLLHCLMKKNSNYAQSLCHFYLFFLSLSLSNGKGFEAPSATLFGETNFFALIFLKCALVLGRYGSSPFLSCVQVLAGFCSPIFLCAECCRVGLRHCF